MGSRHLLSLACLTALFAASCKDLQVPNPTAPDRQRALPTGLDVETLIRGSFLQWWGVSHYSYPAAPFSSAADAASVGWGNFGMKDFGQEPRQPFNNTPEYNRRWIAQVPWDDSYAALAAIRDGFLAIQGGVRIVNEGEDLTDRAAAFGQLVQALSLSNLAVIFDKAFVVDETTNLDSLEVVPYQEVWDAALERFGDDVPAQQEVINLFSYLHAADVLQCDVVPEAMELQQRSIMVISPIRMAKTPTTQLTAGSIQLALSLVPAELKLIKSDQTGILR